MDYLTDEDFALAEANGIRKALAYDRFYRLGWAKKRATTETPKRRIWPDYKEEAEANGVTRHMFFKRIGDGIEPEEAIAMGYIGHGSNRGQHKKRLGRMHVEIAEANGIPEGTARNRVNLYGWDIERAITEPVHVKYRRCET